MEKKKIILVFTLVLGAFVLTGCFHIKKTVNENKSIPAKFSAETPAVSPAAQTRVEISDILLGTGSEAKAGDKVTVHYTGQLLDGTKFDSSLDRGIPFVFKLGSGEVIRGWDEGVPGMKTGGKRKLVIPADLAYGQNAVGSIPANSTLVFEVELIKIESGN